MIINSMALWGTEMSHDEMMRLIVAAHDLRLVAEMVLATASETTPTELLAAADAALKLTRGATCAPARS